MNLKPGSHIHLMGICGTAMASLAGLLQDRGYKITGSDSSPYPPMSTQLENLKIPVMKGYKKENLSTKPDFIIVGNVISANNEEALEMKRLEIPYTSLPKAMGEFIIGNRESFVVTGTHGKTTTTSILAWVAECLNLKPGFLIGGIAKNFSKSFQNPVGNYFVIEGDEYDTAYFDKVPKFIHYHPKHVIMTSVEFDHADIYKDLEAVKDSFRRLMHLIPQDGTLLWCAEDKNTRDIAKLCSALKNFSYGLSSADYTAQVLEISDRGTQFKVQFKGQSKGEFFISLTGDYNVLNTLAVIAICDQQGWNLSAVGAALSSFTGVKRRQEVLGEPAGVLIIEDFAHHPTAVKETILGMQKKYSNKKIFCVFEPRSATSRRKIFQKDYVDAFMSASEVLLANAFDQSKIDEENRFSSQELVDDLRAAGKSANCYNSADEIVVDLVKKAKSGDAVLIMSNGGFDGIYQKLIQALEKRG